MSKFTRLLGQTLASKKPVSVRCVGECYLKAAKYQGTSSSWYKKVLLFSFFCFALPGATSCRHL